MGTFTKCAHNVIMAQNASYGVGRLIGRPALYVLENSKRKSDGSSDKCLMARRLDEELIFTTKT